jgi:osmoprotectant transport system ATP-binding protein
MIVLERVTKSWGGRRAVGPLSLTIPQGQFVALLGGSGCGKTTTLKMINALVAPESGLVRIDGRAVEPEQVTALRRGIGYVFQEIGLFPHMSVAGNVGVGPKLAGWTQERIAARIAELLALVALPAEVAARYPAELSGGQRQRVGVARALAAGPRIMLMDEPFGALDPITRDALGHDYRALHDTLGLTTVMVTHDVMEALQLADRIVVMAAGAILADGSPGELLADHPDETVRALMATPRRQAERLDALLAGAGHG